MAGDSLLRHGVDALLEVTVVPSFSRIGCAVRRRLFGWQEPAPGQLRGQVALVTGATGGLGQAAAAELARLGATVWLCGRDADRVAAARARIADQVPGADLRPVIGDLARLDDVTAMASTVLDGSDRLDILLHNAGALVPEYQLTADGLEYTAQTQVVAPFLLTSLLFGLLSCTPHAKVITVSSGGMYTQRLDVAELDRDPAVLSSKPFNGTVAYARAKRAQVVLTEEWARRTGSSGVTFHAMHPGWVDTPGLRSALPGFQRVMGGLLRTPEQGIDTVVWLATSPRARRTNGGFWHDRRRRTTVRLPGTATAPAEAARLWRWAAQRAGVPANPVGVR